MKQVIFTLFSVASFFACGQQSLPMSAVEGRSEISMADVDGSSSSGVYRYYAKGSDKPFTGVLYSTFDNGQYNSWQEYVNGLGHGQWINYYENGNFKEVGTYVQNRVEGPIKKFYPNGELKAVGSYKDWRVRVGSWTYYDEKGNLVKTENYGEKGSLVEVNEYYKRGDISSSWYRQILAKNGFN